MTFVANDGLGAGFGMAGNFPGGAGNNITIADPDGGTNDIDRSNADLTISAWFLLNNRDNGWQALIAHGEGTDYRVAVRGGNNPIPMSYAGGGAGSDIVSTTTVAQDLPEIWPGTTLQSPPQGVLPRFHRRSARGLGRNRPHQRKRPKPPLHRLQSNQRAGMERPD